MTSFLDRLKAKMSGQNGFAGLMEPAPKKVEKTRNVVRSNRFDDRTWKEVRKVEKIDDLVNDLALGDEHKGGTRAEFEPAPELTKGLFQTFYKAAPQLENKRNLEREMYPVHRIMKEVMDNPKLKELQDLTVGDSLMSTMAIEAMAEDMREIIGRLPPPPPPPSPKQKPDPNAPKQPGGGSDQGEGQGQGQEDPNGQPAQPGQGQGEAGEGDGSEQDEDLTEGAETEEFDPSAEDAEEQAEADWEAEYDSMLDDLDLDRLANKMLDHAEQEASELENLRKGIGLEDGEWHSMSPEEKLAMANRLRTPEMKELAAVIGQMKRFALGIKQTRINDVPHEAYDVETGNDLRRILRPQLGLLATKETSYEFFRRYSEKELLQYKMRGSEEVGKGPIVICIDKSGSMSGSPFNWAMGVAEALRRFAAEEDRDYYAMFFGSNNDRERFDFPEGKGPFEKVMSFLGTVANGGTQFDGVLTEALEKASKSFDAQGKGKADIVFITDGMAHLDDDWIAKYNAERERVGVRQYSVYIGGAYDMSRATGPAGLLTKISDAVISVSELKPESAKKIFEQV